MGQVKLSHIIILVLLFSGSALLIHAQSEVPVPQKSRTLQAALREIPGWHHQGAVDLDLRVVRTLELDDYVNSRYTQDTHQVMLYIGYYLMGQKVGAAHDPMVCYPGQGWKIYDRKKLTLKTLEGQPLRAATMVAELGTRRELLIYWFQAYDATNAGTLQQKLSLLWRKIAGQGQDNAFVRISTSLDNTDRQTQQRLLTQFIHAFYPQFMDFIRDGNQTSIAAN